MESMEPAQQLGKFLIGIGAAAIAVGLFLVFRDRLPGMKWLGQLPGDIRVERENFQFYFPLATSIVVSLVISVVLYLVSAFRR